MSGRDRRGGPEGAPSRQRREDKKDWTFPVRSGRRTELVDQGGVHRRDGGVTTRTPRALALASPDAVRWRREAGDPARLRLRLRLGSGSGSAPGAHTRWPTALAPQGRMIVVPGLRNSPPGAPSTPRRGQKRPSVELRAPPTPLFPALAPASCTPAHPPTTPARPPRPSAWAPATGPARPTRLRGLPGPAAVPPARGPQLSARRPGAGWPGVTLDRDYVQGRTLSNQRDPRGRRGARS
ncbi:gametogenetin-like [Mustela erminea]|uniref:gametogenetin-like n=1 Tax=Mustela erminea TaxID=36723 RepID=UPI001387367D|nr:gametogenetin-like [Mustela erminea]